MDHIHTFKARNGSGTGASSLADGSNLPGGADAWVHQTALDTVDMARGDQVVGVGNAAEILAEVRRVGFYYARNLGPGFDPATGAEE